MDKTKELLILVDGTSYLHRAFHALPALSTSRGEPTGAIYGVINMLNKILDDYHPDYIAIVFDAKGKNFRHEIYHEYKANRPPMGDELKNQILPLYEIISALGLPILSVAGVEADDVIGTIAKEAKEENLKVIIATSDKDLAQIVNPDVTLIDTMQNTILDEEGVKNKFGVPPEKISDYLALTGDQSDNVPGVPNVGPKTAAKWLNTYGSLENIILKAKDIEGKVGENLRQSLSSLPTMQKLVTIKSDVAITIKPRDLIKKEKDKNKLKKFFTHYEFKNLLLSLLNEDNFLQEKIGEYEVILDEESLEKWLDRLRKSDCFAIDTETTSLNFMQAKIVGISFSLESGKAAYIPLAHNYENAPKQLAKDFVVSKIKPLLQDEKKTKVGQNLKYDYHVFANLGIELRGTLFDTMLESYVLTGGITQHNLETLALKYLGLKITSFEDIAGKGVKQVTFDQIPIEKAAPYAAKDADISLQIHRVLWPKISENPKISEVFQKIEMPLLPVLARMERAGVSIDSHILKTQSEEFAKRIFAIEADAYRLAGKSFNLNSPKQLQEIFFTTLELPILEKTPTGQPSTGEAVLQELALSYELPKLILEHRSLSKLKSTYLDSLPRQIEPKTLRIHTSYNQAITSTGRLSSTEPNLQNIPARTEEGRRIRQAFIAKPGYKILSADYSQIELRIMAHLSQDPSLLKAFKNDADIHKATASEIFGVSIEDVSHEQRQRAKAINFGLIYGMSSYGLARQIGVENKIAKEYIERYFARYPSVKNYMEEARKRALQYGFVETIFGRRIYVPEINAQNFSRRAAAERAAINAPMQGSAADIMKLAMIQIDNWILTTKSKVEMLLQVHDELVFEIHCDALSFAPSKIKELMQEAVKLSVPILVHAGIGDNWNEAH